MRRVLHIFSEFTDADIAFIASAGRAQDLAAETVLIEPGTPLEAVHIVLSGALRVEVDDVVIRPLYVGEVVGELSYLDRRPPSARVVVSEPSRLLAIPRSALDAKIAEDSGFAARLYKSLGMFLAMRLRDVRGTLAYGDVEYEPDELDLDELDGADKAARQFAWIIEQFGGG